ncbi:hypothetical protein EPO05_00985 [Patescibacteria group bacterium]|nr:MAG: hypothetical protein EPO05_00985 [Patescibacteria group bacterium]
MDLTEEQQQRAARILGEIRKHFTKTLRSRDLDREFVEFSEDGHRVIVLIFRKGATEPTFTFNHEEESQIIRSIGEIFRVPRFVKPPLTSDKSYQYH